MKGRDFDVSQWGKKYVDGPVTSAVVRLKCGIFTDDEWGVYEVVSERFKMK